MHELSIADSLIEIATEHARKNKAVSVCTVTLRIGALSCVQKHALEFSFDLAAKDTLLEGARLEFTDVPLTLFCETCRRVVELPGIQDFLCPICGTPSADIRSGQELEIDTIEVIQQENAEV